jgi:hypothetical protein
VRADPHPDMSRPDMSRPDVSRPIVPCPDPSRIPLRPVLRPSLRGRRGSFAPIEKKSPTPPGILFSRRGSFPRRASRVPSQLPVRRETNHYPVGNVCSRVCGAARACTVRIDPRDPRTADSLNSVTSDRGAKSHFFYFPQGQQGLAPKPRTVRHSASHGCERVVFGPAQQIQLCDAAQPAEWDNWRRFET